MGERRLIGWRVRYEYATSGNKWSVVGSSLQVLPDARSLASAVRKNRSVRNVRVMRVYRRGEAIKNTPTDQEIIRITSERDYYRNCLLKSEAEIELLRRLFLDVTHYLSDGGGFAYDDMMATIEAIEAFKVSKG